MLNICLQADLAPQSQVTQLTALRVEPSCSCSQVPERPVELELQQHHGKRPDPMACSYSASQMLEMLGLFLVGPRLEGHNPAKGDCAAPFIQPVGPDQFDTTAIERWALGNAFI